MNIFLTLCFVFCSAWAGPYDDVINPLKETTDTGQDFNATVRQSYQAFRAIVERSDYYTSHKKIYKTESESGYVHPVLEYYAFLTSYSSDRKIADVLDNLIKTGGPFGFDRTKKANEAEQFIYDLARHSVNKTMKTKVKIPDNPEEQKALLDIASQHPNFVLDLPSVQSRWDALVDLVQNPNFFNREGLTLMPLAPRGCQEKLFFTNDLFLLGFSLGIAKRLRNHNARHPTFLWEEMTMNNKRMEQYHSYVQWWFPSVKAGVDGLYSPRISATLLRNLEGSTCKPLLQQMNRITWARMATFWGQKIETTGLTLNDNTWHRNWIEHSHNSLRMTRILIWLGAFGLESEHAMMMRYLENTAGTNPGPLSSLRYWKEEPVFYHDQFNKIRPPVVLQ